MGLLEDIVENKKREIAVLHATPTPSFRHAGRAPIDVHAALTRAPGQALRLVTEVKRKSPSAGNLSTKLDVKDRTRAYARGGAAMISVLCDTVFFGGSFSDLSSALGMLRLDYATLPLLCKEFVLDEIQVRYARAYGADAVLLIARILEKDALDELVDNAVRCGLEPIVEVTNEAELERALAATARVIGVNARDLDTLEIDSKKATELVARIPREKVALHFSGVKSEADVAELAGGRADGALIGEVLMREDDPSALLARLIGASVL